MAALAVAVAGIFYFVSRPKPINTLAVLPFVKAGDDQNSRWLTEVMTQRIINDLAQLPGVKVKSFSSVQRYSGEPADPQEAGKRLDVGAVLVVRVAKLDQGDQLAI